MLRQSLLYRLLLAIVILIQSTTTTTPTLAAAAKVTDTDTATAITHTSIGNQSPLTAVSDSRAAVAGGESNSKAVANGAMNALLIRHGRSRSWRHSNEKEHMLWSRRGAMDMNTNTNMNNHRKSNNNNNSIDNSFAPVPHDNGTAMLIAGGDDHGHSLGSDYWPHPPNASIDVINHRVSRKPLPDARDTMAPVHSYPLMATPTTTTTFVPFLASTTIASAPVTHKIRKLHKKKIVESLRRTNGDGRRHHNHHQRWSATSGKSHRSLVEAEHLQGRPMDVEDNEPIAVLNGSDNDVMELLDDDGNANDNDPDDDEKDGEAVTEGQRVIRLRGGSGEKSRKPEPHNHANVSDESDDGYGDSDDGEYQNDEYAAVEVGVGVEEMTTSPLATDADDQAYVTFAPVGVDDNAVMASTMANTDIDADTENDENTKDAFDAVPQRSFVMAKKIETNRNDERNHTKTESDDDDDDDDDDNDVMNPLPATVTGSSALIGNVIEESTEAEDYSRLEGEETGGGQEENVDDETKTRNNTSSSEISMEPSKANNRSISMKMPSRAEKFSQYPGGSDDVMEDVMGLAGIEQQSMQLQEISFDDDGDDDDRADGVSVVGHPNGFPLSLNDRNDDNDNGDNNDDADTDGNGQNSRASGAGDDDENGGDFETNPYLEGVVDAANENEIYDWDEISRNNRRNLMRGRDVVTKFLQIVETQHSLGSNCEAGTSLNLGEGVVDRYAQDRFRVEAEVAVNRANMLTRIFKMTAPKAQADVNLLHASVLSMVEFDDDIFAAGNCFDWNEHPAHRGLFCPFAYRLPPPNLGAILAKDLATEYHYLGNTSEWFFQARKNAEKVIARNEQYLKAFHLYTNKTDERIEDDTLAVKYEDGRWSKPYYDCGGGNIWMLTYTVPFFGYENGTYHFKGTSGIDIDLRRVDIDQCPQRSTPGMSQPLNIFAGTDKCKQRTTMCEAINSLGFRRGSYKCVCRKGYYFPDIATSQKFFNGSLLEEEYEKLMLGKNSTYNIINEYECLPCAEGCDSCEDSSPCIAALNWPMRTSILVLACTVIGLLPPAAWFTFRYQQVKVVRAASPALLRVIALGAFFIYCTNIVMYPNPNLYTCTARIWLREIGFSLTYGALMLKTWRISVIFRVRSAKAVKITDAALLKRLGIICGVISVCLLVRTLVSPPAVVVGRTADDLKAFLCKTDWWDYTFTSMEVLFLAWGVRLCIMVRKAPSEFNESRFISMAIYNEFLLTCFLNVSMLFLQSPANPDLLYIIFFCHTQLTVTLLLALIFGSKVYIVLRSGKSHQENIGLGAKASGAKFNFRPQVRTFANPSSVTTSTAPVAGTISAETKLSDQEALEEIRQLSVQLQRIQEMAPPKGVAVMTISSLLDGLRTPGSLVMVAAAASGAPAAMAASTTTTATGNQLMVPQPQQQQQQQQHQSLPLLSLNTEMQKYNQQMQHRQNNNNPATSHHHSTPAPPSVASVNEIRQYDEKAVNTDILPDGHVICSRCLETATSHYEKQQQQHSSPSKSTPATCQQLGSPQQEGSISFANIKLECMCSQPDDLDQTPTPPPAVTQMRRNNVRSAATNTPPMSQGRRHCHQRQQQQQRRRSSSKRSGTRATSTEVGPDADAPGSCQSLLEAGEVSYQICDKCRKKYGRRRPGSGKFARKQHDSREKSKYKPRTASMSEARSEDLLDRRRQHRVGEEIAIAKESSVERHSTDDIIFCTTSSSSAASSCGASDEEHRSDSDDKDRPSKHKRATPPHKTTDERKEDAADNGDVGTGPGQSQRPGGNSSSNNSNADSAENRRANGDGGDGGGGGSDAGAGRQRRPDKLVLDLNDRSKYTKEVSV